jgi:hypothetical protein
VPISFQFYLDLTFNNICVEVGVKDKRIKSLLCETTHQRHYSLERFFLCRTLQVVPEMRLAPVALTTMVMEVLA